MTVVNNQNQTIINSIAITPFEAIIKDLALEAFNGWPGKTGYERAVQLDSFIRETVTEYATALGMSELDVLAAIEGRRTYSAVNYYQQAKFPSLKGVRIFNTTEELGAAIPSRKFRCPACGGVSTDYQECNSGEIRKDGTTCNWKAYGLFRTMGAGAHIVVKDQFLSDGIVHEIFMPLEFEGVEG